MDYELSPSELKALKSLFQKNGKMLPSFRRIALGRLMLSLTHNPYLTNSSDVDLIIALLATLKNSKESEALPLQKTITVEDQCATDDISLFLDRFLNNMRDLRELTDAKKRSHFMDTSRSE